MVIVMTKPFILFQLDNTTYGIPSEIVQQMEMVEQITPVPNAPSFVKGVVYSRGQVVPAIDLRLKFGFTAVPYTLRTRLIVIHNATRTVGLIVDSAREFILIGDEQIQPPPEQIAGVSGQYLASIATLDQRVVLILDIDALFSISTTKETLQHTEDMMI